MHINLPIFLNIYWPWGNNLNTFKVINTQRFLNFLCFSKLMIFNLKEGSLLVFV